MKKHLWHRPAALTLTALLLAACTAAPQSSSTEEASLIVSAETAKPAATPEQATPAVRREQVTVEREASATLYDGGPLPQQSQPLYYIGNWQGLTWEEVAAKTGFSAEELRILNPYVSEDDQGRLQRNVSELCLSEAWPIPRTKVCRVTVTMPGMPEPYDSRTYQLPDALADDAARALALCYYQMESNGQGFTTEPLPDNTDYVKVTSGVRFDTYSGLKSWLESVYTPEAVSAMLGVQEPYYKEGPDDELWIQGYAFDHIIPQSGLTCTEPEERPDGSLRFAAVCVCVTDDEGNPLDEGQGRLYYAPVHLVPTADGWRVAEAEAPF